MGIVNRIVFLFWILQNYFCHIHNYTDNNQQWKVFSAFNPSKCTHTWSSGHTHTPGAVDTHTHTWSSGHTHTHTHTWSSGHTHTHTHLEQWTHTHTHLEQWAVWGTVGGSVLCSRVSPQSWTLPAGAEIRTHNLGLQVQRSIIRPRLHGCPLKIS